MTKRRIEEASKCVIVVVMDVNVFSSVFCDVLH